MHTVMQTPASKLRLALLTDHRPCPQFCIASELEEQAAAAAAADETGLSAAAA
jgi:hypothetical protein